MPQGFRSHLKAYDHYVTILTGRHAYVCPSASWATCYFDSYSRLCLSHLATTQTVDIRSQVSIDSLGISWPATVPASVASTIDCRRPAPHATVLVVVRLDETALVLVPDGI